MGPVRQFMDTHYRHFNARETVAAARAWEAHLEAGARQHTVDGIGATLGGREDVSSGGVEESDVRRRVPEEEGEARGEVGVVELVHLARRDAFRRALVAARARGMADVARQAAAQLQQARGNLP